MSDQTNYLETLDTVLKQEFKPWEYSLNGYSEDTLCMEMSDGEWLMYRGSRGRKLDARKFGDLLTARMAYIAEISQSESSTIAMREKFLDLSLKNNNLKLQKKMVLNGYSDEAILAVVSNVTEEDLDFIRKKDLGKIPA